MSGIAMGLLKKGYSVSGSDLVKNNETNKLEKLGEIIFNSQIEQPFLSKPIANADIPIPPIPIKWKWLFNSSSLSNFYLLLKLK